MNSNNHVQLIGFLGADPEVKKFDNGRIMARFSIATNEFYTDRKGEKVTQTEWHQVIAWGKLAEMCQSQLKKGKKVAVIGKLTWYSNNDTDGKKYPQANVQANEMHVLQKAESTQHDQQ